MGYAARVQSLPRVCVTTRVGEQPFAVTGSTVPAIRRALQLLGPQREVGGRWRRFGAYTDWEVRWRLAHQTTGAMVRPMEITVEVVAELTLPRWHAPRSASPEVCAKWSRYLDAVRRHERRHVTIAEAAGEAVASALSALPATNGVADLASTATALATERLGAFRALELAYDVETDHGATEGVALPD